jgi:hypothetical protein
MVFSVKFFLDIKIDAPLYVPEILGLVVTLRILEQILIANLNEICLPLRVLSNGNLGRSGACRDSGVTGLSIPRYQV